MPQLKQFLDEGDCWAILPISIANSLSNTQKALNHKGNYVLVDCCDLTEDLMPYEEYRWFRVPDNISEGAL